MNLSFVKNEETFFSPSKMNHYISEQSVIQKIKKIRSFLPCYVPCYINLIRIHQMSTRPYTVGSAIFRLISEIIGIIPGNILNCNKRSGSSFWVLIISYRLGFTVPFTAKECQSFSANPLSWFSFLPYRHKEILYEHNVSSR